MMNKFWCFTNLTILIIFNEICAKPLQNDELELKDESNALSTLKINNKIDKKRVGRQNIRILMDPEEYDEISRNIDNDLISETEVVKKSRVPPKRPSGVAGIVTSILGSSSGSESKASEVYSRVRRQVEQIVETLRKNANQTKLQNQEIEESTENSKNSSEDSDEDEPPGGGDGMGGGILGLLAGLSGEGGQSDLGTLLTTVGSIVANLSGGEGFDLNSLIGTVVGLLAGILGGDGSQSIGNAIGGYIVTALEGLTGGGAMNNGAFLGNLAGTVVGGSSAAGNGGSGEGGGSDSATFFLTLLSSFFGGSSKSN